MKYRESKRYTLSETEAFKKIWELLKGKTVKEIKSIVELIKEEVKTNCFAQ